MKIKQLVIIALLIALSVVLSFLVIPSPTGTIAFDSTPAFVGAVLVHSLAGGIIGFLGHLLVSLKAGMPLGIVSHLLIATFMFIASYTFGYYFKKNKYFAGTMAIVINGVIALIPFGFIMGWEFFFGMLLPLLVASAANVVLAILVLPYLNKVKL